jgi:hypothetical protein
MIFLAFAVGVRVSASITPRALLSFLRGPAGSAACSLSLRKPFVRGLRSSAPVVCIVHIRGNSCCPARCAGNQNVAEQRIDFRVAPFNLSYVLQSKLSVVLQNRTRGVRFQVRLNERDVVESVCVQTATVQTRQGNLGSQHSMSPQSRSGESVSRRFEVSRQLPPPSGKGVVNETVNISVAPLTTESTIRSIASRLRYSAEATREIFGSVTKRPQSR